MKQRIALALFVVVSALASIFIASSSTASTPILRFSGDLDGSMVTQTVVGALGKPLPSPAVGALYYDGGAWSFAGPSTVLGTGAAGQALFTNDAGAATVWAYPHGDVDASATDPGALTVNAIQGFGVSTAAPSTGNALVYSSGLWRPNAINLAGGSSYVTGALPTANQVAQSMVGDVTGTTAANTVVGLTGSGGTVTIGATILQSATVNSSLTIGTNNSGATTTLSAGAATPVLQLADTGSLGTAFAASGAIRLKNNTAIVARNAGNTLDMNLINSDTGAGINIGQASGTGVGIVSIQGNSFLFYAGNGTNYFDAGALHFRGSAHTSDVVLDADTSPSNPTIYSNASGGLILGGHLRYTTRTITASLTVDTTTTDRVIFADCSTSAITLTLPVPTNGRMLTVIDMANNCGNAAGGKQLTLARHAAENIDGAAANVTTSTSGFRFNVWSNGTDWFTQNGTKFQFLLPPFVLFGLRRRRRELEAANDNARRYFSRAA